MDFGIAAIPVITIICYLFAEAIKLSKLDHKWLPVLCGAFGAALGVVGMFTMVDYPAQDVLTAIAVGIISGLAATGANQVFKQLASKNSDK